MVEPLPQQGKNWIRNTLDCPCDRDDPETVLFICLADQCHEPGDEFYCPKCSDNRMLKH